MSYPKGSGCACPEAGIRLADLAWGQRPCGSPGPPVGAVLGPWLGPSEGGLCLHVHTLHAERGPCGGCAQVVHAWKELGCASRSVPMVACRGLAVHGAALDPCTFGFLKQQSPCLLSVFGPAERGGVPPSLTTGVGGGVVPFSAVHTTKPVTRGEITCSAPFYLKSSRVWLIEILWILLAFWPSIRRFQCISWSF